jgi:Zinc-ribbon containing domain
MAQTADTAADMSLTRHVSGAAFCWVGPTDTESQEESVADPVPAGSDVSVGTYKCTNCGNDLQVSSTRHLPPCPSCGNGAYQTISGGDAAADPYPESS